MMIDEFTVSMVILTTIIITYLANERHSRGEHSLRHVKDWVWSIYVTRKCVEI